MTSGTDPSRGFRNCCKPPTEHAAKICLSWFSPGLVHVAKLQGTTSVKFILEVRDRETNTDIQGIFTHK